MRRTSREKIQLFKNMNFCHFWRQLDLPEYRSRAPIESALFKATCTVRALEEGGEEGEDPGMEEGMVGDDLVQEGEVQRAVVAVQREVIRLRHDALHPSVRENGRRSFSLSHIIVEIRGFSLIFGSSYGTLIL
jgi:hypothetical protein